MQRIRYIKSDIFSYASISMMMFAAFASLWSDGANKLGLYIALPISFVLCTLKNKGFKLNIYEKILYVLFAWDCISYLWADDKETAASELHMLLGAFLLTYVVSILGREKKLIPLLYFVWIVLYLSAWNYAIHHILVFMTDSTDRLNDEKLNANTLAYYTFYISFLSYMMGEITNKKWLKRFWNIAFWAMLPASFGISILTASRQILIVELPLYAMLIYIKYIKSVSTRNKILFIIGALICLIAISGVVSNVYDNSFLAKRAETNVADDPRMDLAINAMHEGVANLPLGLGAGNFQSVSITRQISHNSYLEAFVNMGIPGLLLYISLMMVFTLRQWKRYREYKDRMYFAFFTFGVIYTLDGVFFVYYNAIWLISFFMLVAAHSETYYNEKNTITRHTI